MKLPLGNPKQIIKNLLLWKKARTIQSYLHNTGNLQVRIFNHGYSVVQNTSIDKYSQHSTITWPVWLNG